MSTDDAIYDMHGVHRCFRCGCEASRDPYQRRADGAVIGVFPCSNGCGTNWVPPGWTNAEWDSFRAFMAGEGAPHA